MTLVLCTGQTVMRDMQCHLDAVDELLAMIHLGDGCKASF